MFRDPFTNCVLLCFGFIILNFYKVGLKGKSIMLPSTIFAFMWGWTSLGLVLVRVINNSSIDLFPEKLISIGQYEFNILLVCFIAFFCARLSLKKKRFFNIKNLYNNKEIPFLIKKFRWILYLLFFLGVIRLGIVVSSTGLNMGAMRAHYLSSRGGFGILDTNLIRITQYVLQFTIFYICLLGLNAAIKGIELKKIFKDFFLFMPYQFSFGGRLYILSFFVPFFISYLSLNLISPKKFIQNKEALRKISYLIGIALMLIVIMQFFKTGRSSNNPAEKDGGELFYTTTCYVRIYNLFNELPKEKDLPLGYGRNISPWFTSPSPEYTHILEKWTRDWNPALVCVPSMIPDMYLDFGRTGSYFIYFIIFYLIEFWALKSMCRFSFKNFITYVLLCLFAFNSVSSSMSDNLKALFVGLIFIYLLTKFYHSKSSYETIQP